MQDWVAVAVPGAVSSLGKQGRGVRNEPGNKGSSNPVTLPRAFPEQISIEPLITKINVLLFCSLLYKIVILSSFIASNLYTIPF